MYQKILIYTRRYQYVPEDINMYIVQSPSAKHIFLSTFLKQSMLTNISIVKGKKATVVKRDSVKS